MKLMNRTGAKFKNLQTSLGKYLQDGAIVAFSGGVDSSFLLWTAERVRMQAGGSLLALTALSESMSRADQNDARSFAENLHVEHLWKKSLEVGSSDYAKNDWNRCYFCKSELFRIAKEVALEQGFQWILYGYNASDSSDFRPGHQAARENDVVAPLFDAGLTKDEIRILMRQHGLAFSEKPASPCLSSRIMTGIPITPEKLKDVEALESILRESGIRVFRVRICGSEPEYFMRIEVDPAEMESVLHVRHRLTEEGTRRGYRWVTLDLGGYRTGGGTNVVSST